MAKETQLSIPGEQAEGRDNFLEKMIKDDGLTQVEREHPELFDWAHPSDFCVIHGYSTLSEPSHPSSDFIEVRARLVREGYLSASLGFRDTKQGRQERIYHRVTEEGFAYLGELGRQAGLDW
jgi:hypothetical protein